MKEDASFSMDAEEVQPGVRERKLSQEVQPGRG
jgi:hypothetical protein